MKSVIALGLVIVLLPLYGCKTVDGKRTVDSDRVALVLGQAAKLGTRYYLNSHPGSAPSFQLALNAVNGLIDQANYDPAAFADALSKLPINELNGPNGSLYVSTAIVVWDQVAQLAEPVTQKELVKKSLFAVRDGIQSALSAIPPQPPGAPVIAPK